MYRHAVIPRRALPVLALLAVPFLAGSAQARTQTPSSVGIHLPPNGNATYLYGVVSSQRHACEGHRSIHVVRADAKSGPYDPYASGTSNGDGSWTVLPSGSSVVINGFYKAEVSKKHVGGPDCAKAASKPLFVD
jgi:hypothetical protein